MGRDAYLEFIVVGDVVRVAAIDAVSGVEAVVMGPANAARADLERLALAKLKRLLADMEAEEQGDAADLGAPPRRGPGHWA